MTGVVLHLAGETGAAAYCGAPHPSHVTDGARYVDCPECRRKLAAETARKLREMKR